MNKKTILLSLAVVLSFTACTGDSSSDKKGKTEIEEVSKENELNAKNSTNEFINANEKEFTKEAIKNSKEVEKEGLINNKNPEEVVDKTENEQKDSEENKNKTEKKETSYIPGISMNKINKLYEEAKDYTVEATKDIPGKASELTENGLAAAKEKAVEGANYAKDYAKNWFKETWEETKRNRAEQKAARNAAAAQQSQGK